MRKQTKLANFAIKNDIKFIVLFGSCANKSSNNKSDNDISIMLKNNKSIFADFKIYSKILEELKKILNIDSEKLDLSDLGNADILLRYEVTTKGKLLYGNELDYLQFKAFALRDYIDGIELLKLERILIKKRQKLILKAINYHDSQRFYKSQNITHSR